MKEEPRIDQFYNLVAVETLLLFKYLDVDFLTEYDIFATFVERELKEVDQLSGRGLPIPCAGVSILPYHNISHEYKHRIY